MEYFNFEKKSLTKSDFESQKNFNKWEVFSQNDVMNQALAVSSMIKKGETNELSQEENELIKGSKIELNHLQPIEIVDNIDGRIVKSIVYVREPQVNFEETIEKSEEGENITKGTFLDTDLNRELGRVGQTFYKGKRKKANVEEEMYKAMVEKEEYKKMAGLMDKGTKESELYKAMTEAYKDMKDDDYKMMKKAYHNSKYSEMMEKATKYKSDYMNDKEEENNED